MAVRIQNGVVPILPSSYAFNVLALTEVMESISVLYALSKWINGRKQNLNKSNLEEMEELKNIIKRME